MRTDSDYIPNPKVLRILHLEDNERDRHLVRTVLAAAEEAPLELVHVSSGPAFDAALREGAFDLILSDFTMPGYSGSEALKLSQQRCPHVPFIFLSGTIGEEQAIAAIRQGATDYVLKSHLDRLLPAVRRALREADERRQREVAEAARRRAEARFRGLFEHAVEGIYQSTPQGHLLEANRTMARLCGHDSPEQLCAAVRDLARDFYVDPARRAEFTRQLDAQGEVLGYESAIKRKDGSTIWISESARVVRDGAGNVDYYEGMVTDITARKLAEEALRRSEERFRAMAERIDQVFWIATPDMERWLYVSPAYESIWGRPAAGLHVEPRQWLESVVPDDRVRFREARAQVAAGQETRIEYRIRRADGELRWVEERSYPARTSGTDSRHAFGVAMDITQRKLLESQLLQAQKMEAVGQLAGGVAHDFNNVLTVVTGYTRLLLDTRELPPDLIEPLELIFTAGTRAANLTRQLLVFSRKQSVQRRVLDLNEVVTEIAQMLGRLIGEHITLDLETMPKPATIEADSGMLEQVIMNLAVNGRDAMPGGGKLTIATDHVRIEDPTSRRHPAARAGDFVCLSVRDTGCGIAPEHLARIFEPFFTTKDVGQGTGLGLATVFGIVQQHHGWIEVESAVGAGTSFRVMLPACQAAELETAPRRAGKAPPAAGGTETVLLVEDERSVREFAVAVLKSHGYRVLQAASGVEALEVWKWHSPRIAVLFSDLVMPEGLGGLELAATLRREKPTLRVILTSGYAEESVGSEFRPPPGTHFISKPYKPQTLTQTMRDALDGSFHR